MAVALCARHRVIGSPVETWDQIPRTGTVELEVHFEQDLASPYFDVTRRRGCSGGGSGGLLSQV